MPKMISELAQGNQFSRSADGGNLADSATRVWKIILNSPNESIDILAAVGVNIGDPYSQQNPIPCVSIEGRADGESRLVRIVTAQYRTTAGDNGQGEDPKLVMPDVRPANFSTSTSLYEAPAYIFKKEGESDFRAAHNAVGDIIDGLTRQEPITTIRVTQFNAFPGTIHSQYCGYVNSETMSLGSYLTCQPKTVLFRGVEAQPHVETFGTVTYRGFVNSYEFAYRPNYVEVPGLVTDFLGWDELIPHTGFNVKAFNPAAATAEQDAYGQPLRFDDYVIANPLALPVGVTAGDKVRAFVKITNFENGKVSQSPSAQPVPLNDDGTPRSASATPKVKLWRITLQESVNLTETLQLRLS